MARSFYGIGFAFYFQKKRPFEKGAKMELIIGITNAAKFLKCGERTIHRLLEQASQGKEWDETIFPKPFQEKPQKKGVLRIWLAEDLEKFTPRKRGEKIGT